MPNNTSASVHEKFMYRALELAALAANSGEVPVGAVIVREGVIVGEGYNRPVSSVDPTAHAEIVALRDAAKNLGNYRLPGATLYVTLEPCTMCVGAIIHARVSQIVFGATEPKAGAICSQNQLLNAGYFNHQVESVGGVCAEICGALVSQFFQQRRLEKR